MIVAWLTPVDSMIFAVTVCSLVCLALLGGAAAKVGGADSMRGALRVSIWGALAMLATSIVGYLFGTVV